MKSTYNQHKIHSNSARPFPAVSPAVVRAALSEALAKAEVAMLAVQGPKVPKGSPGMTGGPGDFTWEFYGI